MNGLGTFRFHKFSGEEKKTNRYATNNNNYLYPKTSRYYQKTKTYQNRFPINTLNNNINYQSYQFKTKYSADIPNNFLKTFQINNNQNNNIINTQNNLDFPFKKIISTDFESIISHGDLNQIDKLLPQMLYNNLSFSNNNHLILILKQFQSILRFLFNEQEQLNNNNNAIENLFNNKNSNLNIKINELEQDENRSNKLLNANQAIIGKLVKKIRIYKNIIISSGNEKLIPNKRLLDIQKKKGFYICQICNAKTFKTYEDIHAHYIMNHINSYDNKKTLYNNNPNKIYFEKQLNIFKNEIKNTLLNNTKEYNEDKNEDIKNQNNLKNYSKFERNREQKNKTLSSNNLNTYINFNLEENNDINLYLNKLENTQKMQYEKLNDDLNKLKKDLLNEIKNIAVNQQITNKNKKIVNDIKVETNINVNEKNDNKINDLNQINNDKIIENNNTVNKEEINKIVIKENNEKIYDDENKINIKNSDDFKSNIFNNNANNNDNIYNIKESIKNEKENDFNNNNIVNSQANNSNEEDIKKSNNPKLFSTHNRYINEINIIKEESTIKDSTLNNIKDNSKYTYRNSQTPGNPSIIVESHDNPYMNNNNDNSKIENPSNIMEDKKIDISQNIPKYPGKNEFYELFNKRDKTKLLYDSKISIDKNFKIIKNDNENENEEKVNDIIDQETNKYLSNKDMNSLKIDDYRNIILNISNDNKNKGKNNSIFMKYYENILAKYDLNSVLNDIYQKELEKQKEIEKQKELETQKELEKKKELEREKQEKEIDEKIGNSNINFGKSFNLEYDEIINRKMSKRNEQSIKESKINKDSELEFLGKGGGEDLM